MTSSTAAIHVAKKILGLDDDTYRRKLKLITGKASTKEMSEGERQKVLTIFRNEGFAPADSHRRRGRRLMLRGKFAKKLQALWIAGWNLGIVREQDDDALIAFVKRQAKVDHVRFLHDPVDGSKAVDGLKDWIAREGGVVWSNSGLHRDGYMRAFGFKIAYAQWVIVSPTCGEDFWPVVTDLVDHDVLYRNFTGEEWITVMNALGERVRSVRMQGVQP